MSEAHQPGTQQAYTACETQFESAGTIWKSKQKLRNSMQKQLSRHLSDSHEKHARMVSKTIECGTSRPHNVMRTHFESACTIWKSKQKPRNSMQKQLSRPKGIHIQGTFDCKEKAFRQGRYDHRRCSHPSNCIPDPNSLHMQRAALHMHGTYLHAFVSWGEATWTEKRVGRTRGLLPPPLFELRAP